MWYVNQINARYPADPSFMQYGVPSSLLTGVLVELPWNVVDFGPGTEDGQYQWSTFDASIAPYISAGKKVVLAVWGQDYPGFPSLVPAYARAYATNVVPACSAFPTWIAAPYSPDLLAAYKNFVAEVVRHYANNPAIGYVRIGLSSGGEIHRYCGPVLDTYPVPAAYSGPPYNCSTASNAGQCVWLAYDKDMLSFEQSQSPSFVVIGPSTSQNQANADPTNVYSSAEDDQAVAAGFGFGSQGLQKSDSLNYGSGLQCNSNWCAKFDQYAGQVPLELQTLDQSDPACTGIESICTSLTGSLVDSLPFADARHATIFEIYENDVYTALSPFNPNYALYGAQYRSALQATLQSNPVVSVNASGVVTGLGAGSTNVFVQYGGITGSVTVNVSAGQAKGAKQIRAAD
jgi:hypothetical protein